MKDKDKCLWHTRLAPVAFPFFPQQKISGMITPTVQVFA
jgi:hypothetical protein